MTQDYVRDSINRNSFVYRLADLVVIQCVLLLSIYSYDSNFNEHYSLVSLIASIVYLLLAENNQLYHSGQTRFYSRLTLNTFLCWLFAIFAVTTYLFFTKTGTDISRVVIGLWLVLTSFGLIGWRYFLHLYLCKYRSLGFNLRKVAIIGLTDSGIRLADELTERMEIGCTLTAFFDDREVERLSTKYIDFLGGSIDSGVKRAKDGEFDLVYIALPFNAQNRIESILRYLGDTTVDVHIVSDFFTFNLLNSRLSYMGNVQTISVYESPMSGLSSVAKRVEDIIGSLIILPIIMLPMLAIALLIKLDSRGPVFFKQKRYGLDGKSIDVLKFRSMTVSENGTAVKQATKGDARVTKLGAFLRRTSLDELPQFINVLFGQMSIVGPRPHAVVHNETYRELVDFYMLRHKVKPGITGWAQVNGWRGETDTLDKMKKRIEFDLEYIRSWSILLDIKIIFMTIIKGFSDKNAY
ncbi:undecaprenyl-phosphate glucose phosphotransferase [Psychromonas sp. MME2]|uniref:undecaprenyl-phosphate glucose phosphotransferase n=1 Tax=unclassified Psychromonas TaxID=2614957 RepID=UPI00339CBCBA